MYILYTDSHNFNGLVLKILKGKYEKASKDYSSVMGLRIRLYMCMYIYLDTYACTCTYFQGLLAGNAIANIFIYIHLHIYACIYKYMYMYLLPRTTRRECDWIYVDIYAFTYGHIYIYIYINSLPRTTCRYRVAKTHRIP